MTTALVLRRDWHRWNTPIAWARMSVMLAAAYHAIYTAFHTRLERAISDFVAVTLPKYVQFAPPRLNAHERRAARMGHKARGYPPTNGKRPLNAVWIKNGHGWRRVGQIKGVRFHL